MPNKGTQASTKARRFRRKQLRAQKGSRCVPYSSQLGNFATTSLGSTLNTLYMSNGGNGSVTTKHELGLHVVDFFNYQSAQATTGGVPQYVHNYFWDVDQNLFNTYPTQPGSSSTTWCRVRKVEVWVMPQSRGDIPTAGATPVIETNANQMLTVNVQCPGIVANRDETVANTANAMDTQVTNVLPTINPKWKKVFTCDLQKTFQSGVARPYFHKGGLTPPSYSNQCLFSMSITDPVSGRPYQTGNYDDADPDIRVKVKLLIDQPIAILNRAKFAVFRNEDFALPGTGQNGPNFYDSAESYCQMDLVRALDYMR